MIALKNAFDKAKESDNEIIFVGLSRGACAIVNLFEILPESDVKKIKAVVLISPFAHAYDIFERNIFLKVLYFIFKMVSCFKEDGLHPINCVEKISKTIPVLFACSKTDKTVPYTSTMRLYKKLLDSGHQKVHMLCLDSGAHAKFLKCEYAQKFRDFVHAFYQKYGLACNIEFADIGLQDLKFC